MLSCIGNKSELYSEKPNSPFFKTIMTDSVLYIMQYRPVNIVSNHEDVYGYDNIKPIRDINGTVWFNIVIRIPHKNVSPLRWNVYDHDEYMNRYNYFLNSASKDIQLMYGKKILQPISYTFETTYNLAPQETIVVGFELPEGDKVPSENMQLSYIDRVFNNGIIKATYLKEELLVLKTE